MAKLAMHGSSGTSHDCPYPPAAAGSSPAPLRLCARLFSSARTNGDRGVVARFVSSLSCLLIPLWLACVASAQDEAAAEDTPLTETERIQGLIEKRVEEEAAKLVDKMDIAIKLDLEWPVEEPSEPVAAIQKRMLRKIATLVDAKFPNTVEPGYRAEAESKYRLRKKGDYVSFIVRGGKGTHVWVHGRLREVNQERVIVDNRWIIREDIAREDMARLDPVVSKRMKKRYVHGQLRRYQMKRETYADRLKAAALPKAYSLGGYVPREDSSKSSEDPEDWVSAHSVFEKTYRTEVNSLKAKIRPTLEEEIYTANGFVYMEEEGRWVPKKEADSLTGKLKRLLMQ